MQEEAFKSLGETEGVAKMALALEFMSFKDGHPTLITGLDPSVTDIGPIKPTLEKGECCEITKGRYLNETDKFAAVVAESFAFAEQIDVGSTIQLGGKNFEIVGLINTGKNARIAGAEVFIPIKTAQEIVNKGNIVSTVFLKLSNKADPKIIEDKIKELTKENVTVTTSSDFLATVAGMSELTKNVTAGVSIIVLILISLFVIKSSLASISERKKEIGIMKAIGWRDSMVARLIITENLIQSFIGGIAGCIIGYCIAYLYAFNARLSLPRTIASYPACASSTLITDLKVVVTISPLLIIFGLIMCVGLGLLAGYAGAKQISKLQPADALRQL
jgi:ABC-type antimicrobial peptide transport system permease subunit